MRLSVRFYSLFFVRFVPYYIELSEYANANSSAESPCQRNLLKSCLKNYHNISFFVYFPMYKTAMSCYNYITS